jgi:hypothetical protein
LISMHLKRTKLMQSYSASPEKINDNGDQGD